MSTMFEFAVYAVHCEYAELHAPSSFEPGLANYVTVFFDVILTISWKTTVGFHLSSFGLLHSYRFTL